MRWSKVGTWMALGLEGAYQDAVRPVSYAAPGAAAESAGQSVLRSDPARALGSGWSDLEIGLRVRYEWRRELAPYLGLKWSRLFGSTAELARAGGRDAHELNVVVGVKFWF